MSIYLLILSLALHLFTILWIIIYMQKPQKLTPFTQETEKVKAEIEDLLVAYTTEMKEENEKLLAQLKQRQQKERNALQENRVTTVKPDVTEAINPLPKMNQRIATAYGMTKPVIIEQENRYNEPPPVDEDLDEKAKVIALAKQGFTSVEIAKKLNIGKGEVDLLLKFYQ